MTCVIGSKTKNKDLGVVIKVYEDACALKTVFTLDDHEHYKVLMRQNPAWLFLAPDDVRDHVIDLFVRQSIRLDTQNIPQRIHRMEIVQTFFTVSEQVINKIFAEFGECPDMFHLKAIQSVKPDDLDSLVEMQLRFIQEDLSTVSKALVCAANQLVHAKGRIREVLGSRPRQDDLITVLEKRAKEAHERLENQHKQIEILNKQVLAKIRELESPFERFLSDLVNIKWF